MSTSSRLLVATSNPGKMRELAALFADVPCTLVSLQDLPSPVAPPDETGETCTDNARLKATAYARAAGLPCLAEDSGFEVDALDGLPGVRSARVPGADDEERNAWVYAQLDARGSRESTSPFRVGPGARPRHRRHRPRRRGRCLGPIAPEPRGSNGFGYDPLLFYPPLGRTSRN